MVDMSCAWGRLLLMTNSRFHPVHHTCRRLKLQTRDVAFALKALSFATGQNLDQDAIVRMVQNCSGSSSIQRAGPSQGWMIQEGPAVFSLGGRHALREVRDRKHDGQEILR